MFCRQLKSVVLGDGVLEIDDDAFAYCDALDSIALPDSIQRVGSSAFNRCASLESIVLPKQIREIDGNPFVECRNLRSIHLDSANPQYLVNDGILFDRRKKSLVSYPQGKWRSEYTIPNGVLEIGEAAFSGSSISGVHFPRTLTSIGSSAFEHCSRIRRIEIPASVSEIGINPFMGCLSLSSILVEPHNAHFFSIDDVLYGRNTHTLISYPPGKNGSRYEIENGTRRIGKSAFSGCDKLTTIILPDGIEEIEESAFSSCPISEMTMPSSLKSIGRYAFVECDHLRRIQFLGNRPSVGLLAFHNFKPLTFVVLRRSTGWNTEMPDYWGNAQISIQYVN